MIRPAAFLSAMLAAGAGLYLYQVKHRTLVLDAQIAQTLKQADAARARTALLKAEYAMLNQPDRLGQLAGRYLDLHPLTPGQYVQLASLDARLPPVQHYRAPGELPARPVSAPTTAADTTDADADVPAADPLANLPTARTDTPLREPALRASAMLMAANQTHPPAHLRSSPAARTAGDSSSFPPVDRPHAVPVATPRPAYSSPIATAALRPINGRRGGAAYAEGAAPPYMPAPAYRPVSAPAGGSMLGETGGSLAPPVPISN